MNSLPEKKRRQISESFRNHCEDLSGEGLVDEVMKEAGLSELERPYAEHMCTIDPNTYDSNEWDAVSQALRQISDSCDKQRTMFFQENIHINPTWTLDIDFPNAKVIHAQGAQQFVSHELFRVAQSYDVAIMDYGDPPNNKKTGDTVRVYSDGVHVLIQ